MNRAFILIFLSLSLLSCDFKVKKDPESLVFPLHSEPGSLNPIISASDGEASKIYGGFIYESLIELDNETLEPVPSLAKSWDVSDDHLVYTFYLRDDVRWSDGVPFTADDVIYAFEKIRDPKVFAPHLRVYYMDIDRVEKINDHTVRYYWSRPYFKALQISGGISPVPKHVFDDGNDFNTHHANRAPVGTGPFVLMEWKTGRKIVLKRNDDYWKGRPGIKEVIFRTVGDETATLQEAKKGNFDVVSVRPIQWARQLDKASVKERFIKREFLSPNYTWIGWNERRPYFKDKKVRQALTMMVNREKIIDKILFGLAKETTGPFYINGPDYDKSVKPLPFDPESAKRYLSEAGWADTDGDGILDKDGVAFKFTYLIPAGARIYDLFGNMMREDLGKAGIVVDIKRLEWASFIRDLNARDFDAVSLVWSLGVDQDPYQIWHSSQTEEGSNFIGYNDPRVDELIEKGRVEFDKEKRREMYKEIHRIIYDDQPYTFLFSGMSLLLRNNRFINVVDYPLGWDYREWKVK